MRSLGGCIGLGLLLLAGCATAPPDIRLRNPQTGRTFTCSGGGPDGRSVVDEMAKRTRDNCVTDLQSQGYVVITEPASR